MQSEPETRYQNQTGKKLNYNKSNIFDFVHKRRRLNTTRSFTHVLRLKQQWFSVLSTHRIKLMILSYFRLYTSSFKDY